MSASYPFVDLALAQRLERTEARANAAFVDSRARVQPESGAVWKDFGGAYAMFDGVESPLTQTFGLGLFSAPGDEQLAEIEAFFAERRAEVFHEVSPLADPVLLSLLARRGYVPIEVTSVLFRPIEGNGEAQIGSVRARRIEAEEGTLWAETAAAGWSSESAVLGDFMLNLGKISTRAEGTHCFLAEEEERPIAAGAMSIADDVAILAGASTVPSARKRGAQRALLHARLQFAAQSGCTLATMGALPGSASQRNAERQGFRIAYTRIKWHRTRT